MFLTPKKSQKASDPVTKVIFNSSEEIFIILFPEVVKEGWKSAL